MIDARKILLPSGSHKAVQMRVVTAATWPQTCSQLPRATQKWADAQNFTGAPGSCLHVPNGEGAIVEVIVGSNGGDGFKFY